MGMSIVRTVYNKITTWHSISVLKRPNLRQAEQNDRGFFKITSLYKRKWPS